MNHVTFTSLSSAFWICGIYLIVAFDVLWIYIPKVFHKTPNKMSWGDALTYCRTHYTDLALIESAEENTAAFAVNGYAWIGLFRSTGKWSDNRTVAFTAWKYPGDKKIYHEVLCNSHWTDCSKILTLCKSV
uniref:C-type lectin domain-containing protein n=1 Tax=Neogobius melanostomus TaxID=47308 RepID=A0A8C6STD6_9GOBI